MPKRALLPLVSGSEGTGLPDQRNTSMFAFFNQNVSSKNVKEMYDFTPLDYQLSHERDSLASE